MVTLLEGWADFLTPLEFNLKTLTCCWEHAVMLNRPLDDNLLCKLKTCRDLPVSSRLTGFSFATFHRVTSELAATTNYCLSTQVQAVIFCEALTWLSSKVFALSARFRMNNWLPQHSSTCWSVGEASTKWGAYFFLIGHCSTILYDSSKVLIMTALDSV